jgi:hypothetical protein
MTPEEIIKELSLINGKLPEAALRSAIEQREAVTPHLLRVLETAAADPAKAAKSDDWLLPTLGIFLLAQFREKRAFPLLMRICEAPGEIPFDIIGDTVTEGLCRILASVYDGDAAPFKALIANQKANEFVRAAGLDTFLVLEATGQMPRQEVVDYLRSLLRGGLERDGSYTFDGLASAVAKLPAPELLEDVRIIVEEGLTEQQMRHVVADLSRPPKSHTETASGKKALIDDTIAEVEWWACFREEPVPSVPIEIETDTSDEAAEAAPEPEPHRPAPPPTPIRVGTKTGRNDPCPCGSGKKYKKCCLGNELPTDEASGSSEGSGEMK